MATPGSPSTGQPGASLIPHEDEDGDVETRMHTHLNVMPVLLMELINREQAGSLTQKRRRTR